MGEYRKTGFGKKAAAELLIAALVTSCLQPAFASNKREALLFAEIPIVFTATKTAQRADEAPATVDVITAQDIEELNLRTLADALRYMPGMDVTDVVTTVNFSMRGLNGRQWNNTTLCLVDGHPFNEVVGGHTDPTCIPLYNVARIEVVRGPGSALYGANALTGVINIITKTAAEVNGAKVNAGIGTHATADRDIGKRIEQDKEDVLIGKQAGSVGVLAGMWHKRDSSVGGGKINSNDDREDFDYTGKIDYKDLVIGYSHFRSNLGIPSNFDQPAYGLYKQLLGNRTKFDRDFATLDYKYDVTDKLNLALRTHLYQTKQADDYEEIDFITSALNGRVISTMAQRVYDGKRLGAELQSTYRLAENNTIVVGAETRLEKVEAAVLGGTQNIDTNSIYAQDEWKPLDNLIFTLGARFDKANAYKEKLSPRGSIVFKASDVTTLKASYGEAFRAPNFLELYADIWEYGGFIHISGNKDIKPEKIETIEFGGTRSFGKNFQAGLNIFKTRIYDRIVRADDNPTPVPTPNPIGYYLDYTYVNRELAEVIGAELSLKYHVAFFDAMLNYAWQEARDKKKEIQIAYAPKGKANLRLRFDLGKGFTFNTLSYFNESGQNPETDNVFVTNAKLMWNTTDNLTLALASNNVFNAQYAEVPNIPLVGRSIFAEVSYKFNFMGGGTAANGQLSSLKKEATRG